MLLPRCYCPEAEGQASYNAVQTLRAERYTLNDPDNEVPMGLIIGAGLLANPTAVTTELTAGRVASAAPEWEAVTVGGRGVSELASNGEGLFTNVTRTSYKPASQLLGQTYDFSCAAASCTMAADLLATPEAYVRQAILTDTNGTALSNIPEGLKNLGFKGTADYSTNITTHAISEATSNGGSVIVNVTTDSGGVHAIVVDSIVDGIANIRDPWPIGVGSSYGVPVDALESVLTGKSVIIHQ